jgi:hypothetical protein
MHHSTTITLEDIVWVAKLTIQFDAQQQVHPLLEIQQ